MPHLTFSLLTSNFIHSCLFALIAAPALELLTEYIFTDELGPEQCILPGDGGRVEVGLGAMGLERRWRYS